MLLLCVKGQEDSLASLQGRGEDEGDNLPTGVSGILGISIYKGEDRTAAADLSSLTACPRLPSQSTSSGASNIVGI